MEGKEENHDPNTVAPSPATAVVGGQEPLSAPPASDPAPAAGDEGVVTPGFKKKRGRPRKYGPDGKLTVALSPMPISASIPLAGDFSGWKGSSIKKKHKLLFDAPGDRVAYSVGANFTPHVIKVNSGEDVNMKIISFAQQGCKAICILAANGAISNVTLGQPNSCGGTLTYEGRFEILSLSGAFMPNDIGGTKGRSGGMSVSLVGPDGRVLGGGLAGMLVAAGPVQVVLGSFLVGHQQEEQQKLKKSRFEPVSPPPPPIAAASIFHERTHISFTPVNSINGSRNLDLQTNGSLQHKEINTSHFQFSC